MKKLLGVFIILALVFGVVSCKKNKNGGDASFKMSRVNLNGARYLALANKEAAKDGENGGFLYSVDDEGNLQIMAYEYDCDDSGIASELKRSLTIQITAMIPVGDVYIWLMGCRYQCNDYSGFSDDMAARSPARRRLRTTALQSSTRTAARLCSATPANGARP